MKLQKLGGYATFASLCGFSALIIFSVLRLPRFGNLNDPITAMAARSSSPLDFYIVNLLLMVCTFLWMITIFALNDQMKTDSPNLTSIATIAASITFAIIIVMATVGTQTIELIAPTRDVSAYRAVNAMYTTMWMASGHTFGWTCLLIGFAVLKSNAFPKMPAWLYILAGIFWIRIPIPINRGLAYIPYILWLPGYIWFGIKLLKQKHSEPIAAEQNTSA
jgi:hypothetical protein